MDTLTAPPGPGPAARPLPLRLLQELLERQRTLTRFAALLLLLMLPMAVAWGLDERTLRGVGVWVKPMKFAAAIALLALTTAWFVGHLPAARRRSRAVGVIVATLIASGSFELAYITLQAALGAGSHYNVGDPLHAVMYSLMGLGALLLTATQPMLALQLWRHPDPARAPALRLSVQLGLGLSFVLGATVGGLLSGLQPPSGAGLPVVGWSTTGGDLRPAHFLGIHAGQLLPLAGLAVVALRLPAPRRWVAGLSAGYAALCAALVAQALAGRPLLAI